MVIAVEHHHDRLHRLNAIAHAGNDPLADRIANRKEELATGDFIRRKDNPRAPSLLYKVIDSRTRQRSTALVSNVDFGAWDTYLGDAPMATAMLDRVVDGAIIHKFQGKSYRAHRARRPSAGKASKDQRDAAR